MKQVIAGDFWKNRKKNHRTINLEKKEIIELNPLSTRSRGRD